LRAWSYDGGPFRRENVQRQSRHGSLDEPLGGHAHPLIRVEGSGSILLDAPAGRHVVVLELDDDPVYVREDALAGFEPSVTFLNGKLPVSVHEQVPLVQLSGVGSVVLLVPERLVGMGADGSHPVAVRSDRVLGWVGRLFPRVVTAEEGPGDGSSMVSFSGEGTVLVRLDG
jgi:uncharacterized protein (AIM24 family)